MPDEIPPADAVAEESAAEEAPSEATQDLEELPEKKKPKLIRISGFIVLGVILAIVALVVWFVSGPMMRASIHSSVNALGFRFGDETQINASVFSGSIAIENMVLDQDRKGDTKRILDDGNATMDLAVMDTLTSRDVIFDRVSLTDTKIVMRRFKDGSIPGVQVPDDKTETDAEESPVDNWLEWWDKAEEWRERVEEWLGEDGSETEDSEQPATHDPNDPRAITYHPKPTPSSSSFPRVLVKELQIDSASIGLPPHLEVSKHPNPPASPFDVHAASLTGTNVTTSLQPGEQMELSAKGTFTKAGPFMWGMKRQRGKGSWNMAITELPLATLADPAVAGDTFATYGLSGQAGVSMQLSWTGPQLQGNITLTTSDMNMQPTADAPSEAHEAAKALQQVNSQYQQLGSTDPLVITWSIGVEGTIASPRLTGAGFGGLAKAIKQSLTDLAKKQADRLKAEAGKQVDAVKNQAQDTAKGLLQDVIDGKDPKDSGKDAEKKTKDSVKDGVDGIKKLFGR